MDQRIDERLIDQITRDTDFSRDQASRVVQAVIGPLHRVDVSPDQRGLPFSELAGGESASVAHQAHDALGAMRGMED